MSVTISAMVEPSTRAPGVEPAVNARSKSPRDQWPIPAGVMLGTLRRFGRDDKTIPHADASETGEMLVLKPDLVHMDRAERGFTGEVDPEKLMKEGLKAVTKNGVLGDPVGATEEMGEEVISALVDFLFEQASALEPA